jgi:hypothetical protein
MRRISAGLQRADPVARDLDHALGEARMLLTLHNIIAGFLRRTWLIAAVTVVVCAAFAAHAVAALSDAALTSPAPTAFTDRTAGASASSAAPPAPSPAPRRAPPDGTSFAARNIFCSACAPAGPGPGPGNYQGQPAVLIATSLGNEPRATVRVLPTEVQGSWGLGEEIPGVGRLDEIHATAIEVADTAGHTRLISLLDIGGPGGPGGPGDPAPTPGADPGPFADRYTKLNDTTFEVDRSLIRELVTSAAKPGMGGAVAVVVDGEVRGIRLVGIGPKSPGRALELRSGDVISSIDGEPLRTAQQLLDLFARLEQVSSVELGGTRAGKPLKRTLKLR